MRKLYLIIILITFGFINPVRANTISLDPVHIRLSASAGEVKNGVVKIDNPSPKQVRIKVYLEDWRYSSSCEGTKEFFPAGTTALSCAKWISFSPAEFNLPAFGRQEVNYTMRLPQETEGSHFAVMFFETDLSESKAQESESMVRFKARLGALFSIEANGSLNCQASLENIQVKKEEGVIRICANFENKGNTDIAPTITFHIIDAQGNVFSRGKFSDIFTLPQDKGEIFAESKENLQTGGYILVITMDFKRGLPRVLEVPIKVNEFQIILAKNG